MKKDRSRAGLCGAISRSSNDILAMRLNTLLSWHLLFFLYLMLRIFLVLLSLLPPPLSRPPETETGWLQATVNSNAFSLVAHTTWHTCCCTRDKNRGSPTVTCACHGPAHRCSALVGQVFSTKVPSLLIRCWNPRRFLQQLPGAFYLAESWARLS